MGIGFILDESSDKTNNLMTRKIIKAITSGRPELNKTYLKNNDLQAIQTKLKDIKKHKLNVDKEDYRHIIAYNLVSKALEKMLIGMPLEEVAKWLENDKAWLDPNTRDYYREAALVNNQIPRTLLGIQAGLTAWLANATSCLENLYLGDASINKSKGSQINSAKDDTKENWKRYLGDLKDLQSIQAVDPQTNKPVKVTFNGFHKESEELNVIIKKGNFSKKSYAKTTPGTKLILEFDKNSNKKMEKINGIFIDDGKIYEISRKFNYSSMAAESIGNKVPEKIDKMGSSLTSNHVSTQEKYLKANIDPSILESKKTAEIEYRDMFSIYRALANANLNFEALIYDGNKFSHTPINIGIMALGWKGKYITPNVNELADILNNNDKQNFFILSRMEKYEADLDASIATFGMNPYELFNEIKKSILLNFAFKNEPYSKNPKVLNVLKQETDPEKIANLINFPLANLEKAAIKDFIHVFEKKGVKLNNVNSISELIQFSKVSSELFNKSLKDTLNETSKDDKLLEKICRDRLINNFAKEQKLKVEGYQKIDDLDKLKKEIPLDKIEFDKRVEEKFNQNRLLNRSNIKTVANISKEVLLEHAKKQFDDDFHKLISTNDIGEMAKLVGVNLNTLKIDILKDKGKLLVEKLRETNLVLAKNLVSDMNNLVPPGNTFVTDPQASQDVKLDIPKRFMAPNKPKNEKQVAHSSGISLNLFDPDPMNKPIVKVIVGERPPLQLTQNTKKSLSNKDEDVEDNAKNAYRHIVAYTLIEKALKNTLKGLTPNEIAAWLDDNKNWLDPAKAADQKKILNGGSSDPTVPRTLQGVQAAVDAWLKNATNYSQNLFSGNSDINQKKGSQTSANSRKIDAIWREPLMDASNIASIECIDKQSGEPLGFYHIQTDSSDPKKNNITYKDKFDPSLLASGMYSSLEGSKFKITFKDKSVLETGAVFIDKKNKLFKVSRKFKVTSALEDNASITPKEAENLETLRQNYLKAVIDPSAIQNIKYEDIDLDDKATRNYIIKAMQSLEITIPVKVSDSNIEHKRVNVAALALGGKTKKIPSIANVDKLLSDELNKSKQPTVKITPSSQTTNRHSKTNNFNSSSQRGDNNKQSYDSNKKQPRDEEKKVINNNLKKVRKGGINDDLYMDTSTDQNPLRQNNSGMGQPSTYSNYGQPQTYSSYYPQTSPMPQNYNYTNQPFNIQSFGTSQPNVTQGNFMPSPTIPSVQPYSGMGQPSTYSNYGQQQPYPSYYPQTSPMPQNYNYTNQSFSTQPFGMGQPNVTQGNFMPSAPMPSVYSPTQTLPQTYNYSSVPSVQPYYPNPYVNNGQQQNYSPYFPQTSTVHQHNTHMSPPGPQHQTSNQFSYPPVQQPHSQNNGSKSFQGYEMNKSTTNSKWGNSRFNNVQTNVAQNPTQSVQTNVTHNTTQTPHSTNPDDLGPLSTTSSRIRFGHGGSNQ